MWSEDLFSNGLTTTSPMIKAKLSYDFIGIDTATFSSAYATTDSTGVTLIDSLGYVTYNAEDKA